jgi:nitrite reductase/ring-hydroxylating ferredoxin subunit
MSEAEPARGPALRVVDGASYADWESVYAANGVAVYRLVYRQVGNHPDAEDLTGQAARFSTGTVEGFVVNRGGRLQAISAVCTHLGCILRPGGAGRLACPCHRTAFSFEGTVVFHELPEQPPPLPLLRTRVRGGRVEVLTV